MIIAPEFPSIAYDGEPTFAGILQKYFVETDLDALGCNIGISKRWNETTAESCAQDYERRILKTLADLYGKEKPAHELTSENFEQVLRVLAEEKHYSDNTVAHYRHLMYLVYRAGVDHNHFPDTLFWESDFDAETASDKEKEDRRVKVMTRMRKSFSVEEELKIVRWFWSLKPESATGEDIGLLLMFTLGVRNNEACGANYDSIHCLDNYPDAYVFDMLQSTMRGSAELKGGGKTSNAPRTLLVMKPIYDFLQSRRDYMEKLIENGELDLPEGTKVGALPLVCKGLNYTQRAETKDLAAHGKELFIKIGIDKSELSELFSILCKTEVQELQIEDKEPTTYLFRRNCATHLYQLGFSVTEIQYWMGHEIEDVHVMRSFFADPDQIYALKERWDRHPVLKVLQTKGAMSENKENTLPIREKETEHSSFRMDTILNNRTALVCIDTHEPRSNISISACCDTPNLTIKYHTVPQATEYSRYAVISRAVNDAYLKRL